MLKGISQSLTQVAKTASDAMGKAPGAAGKSFDAIRREMPAEPTAGVNKASGPLGADRVAASNKPGVAERSVQSIVSRDQRIERAMNKAMRGADMSPRELLALQLQVHKYSMEVETVGRVVDRVTGAVKQAMNTQI